jgi:hypothetical protein
MTSTTAFLSERRSSPEFLTFVGCAIVFLTFFLTSCEKNKDIDDISISSVSIVYTEKKQLDFDEEPKTTVTPSGESGELELLRVNFVTSRNLKDFATETGFHVGSEIFPCEKQNAARKPAIGGGSIYSEDGVAIDSSKTSRPQEQSVGSRDKKFLFHTFLPVRKEAMMGGAASEAFDLSKKPFDLCLMVRGGAEGWGSFQSNIAVVGEDAVTSAMAR